MRQIRNEEIFDKKTQERKKNQQTQAQIQGLNGSQNLIDLLTLLLKPAFNFNNGGGGAQQYRSRSAMNGNQYGVHQGGRNYVNGGGSGMPNQMNNNYHHQNR
jgi:hypothetical protein